MSKAKSFPAVTVNCQRTHLDLFSGIGGFAIAAQNCGYTTIGFCEKEPYAQQILKERFGAVLADPEHNGLATSTGGNRRSEQDAGREKESSGTKQPSGSYRKPQLHPDIFTLNGADYAGVDLLTGGFPCQPFSVAGKRLGKADNRAIWPQMLRVIQEARPTWIIGENVAGIITMELDNILSDLEGIGYAAWPLVIPACAVDARHRRDRVWIIARRNVEDSAGERSRGESGNALHQGRGASEAGGTGIPQATGRQNGSAIGDDWTTGQDVAYTASGQDDGRNGGSVDAAEGRREGQHAAAHARGKDVARADSGRGEQRDKNERSVPKPDSECAGIGEDVAHADEPSRQGNQRTERSQPERAEHQQHRGRQLESAVCGMADGLPERLDGGGAFCQWTEEDPTTPRVSTGIKHRAHRLRGLGNSICPPVVEEIIREIASLR